jgi:hypothetical protein
VIDQLDAYNARDIDAFCATFDAGVEVYELEELTLRFRGIQAVRERYGRQFAQHPQQRSLVVTRQALGELVFDTELITGNAPTSAGEPAPNPYHLMAIYRVRGGLIDRVWFSKRVPVGAGA